MKDSMTNEQPAVLVHAPHRPLTEYYQTEQDRQAYLRRIFDDTAPDYDRIEACVQPEQVMATLGATGLTQVGRHLELGIFSQYHAEKARPPA